MTANVTVKGTPPQDPRERTRALASAAEVLTKSVGGDPSDAIMTLLRAAAKIAMETTTELSRDQIATALKSLLSDSVVAAGHWFAGDRQPSTLN